MNKKEILKQAYEAGQNDTLLQQLLYEHAQEFFNSDVPEIEDDEERDNLLNKVMVAYEDGFMLKMRPDLK